MIQRNIEQYACTPSISRPYYTSDVEFFTQVTAYFTAFQVHYEKETGKMKADYICFVDEEINPEEDLLLFDPSETWKKTKMKAGTYTVREMMQPIFINGECVYTSPSVKEIAAYCRQEKDTLWDESKRLFNPHQMYIDLSPRLYEVKKQLLDRMSADD